MPSDSTAEKYCETLKDEFENLYAAWPPNSSLKLGDYGTVSDSIFERKGNIDKMVSKWKVRQGKGKATYSLTTAAGTKMRLLGKGEVTPAGVPVAKASAEISFSSGNSVFFNAAGCVVDEIEDQTQLGRELMSLFEMKQWEAEWHVVTRLVSAASTTIAVSKSAGAGLKLEAKGDEPQLDLADATLKLQATSRNSIENLIVTEGGLTPLMGLSRVKRKFFGGVTFKFSDKKEDAPAAVRDRLLAAGKKIEEGFEWAEV
jgi:hypothetical protein